MGNSNNTEETKDFFDADEQQQTDDNDSERKQDHAKSSSTIGKAKDKKTESFSNKKKGTNTTNGNNNTTESPPPPHNDYDYLLKPILIGDSGTGKTICIHQITQTPIVALNVSTIGVDYQFKYYSSMMRGKSVKLKVQYWDTAGQKRFRDLTYGFYSTTHVFLLMYDVTNKSTFDNIPVWLKTIRQRNTDAIIILVGNKIDLLKERSITTDEGLKLATENEIDFVEVSSLNGTNFNILEKLVLENGVKYIEKREYSNDSSSSLENSTKTASRGQSTNSLTSATHQPLIVSRRRQVIQNSSGKKLEVSIQMTETDLVRHEKSFWKSLFPKSFPIDDSTVFKIMENYNAMIIDNIRENCTIEFYFINESNLNTFLIECKQVYFKSTFKNYEYRVVDASQIYKNCCQQQLKIKPEPSIAQLFEVIDERHTTCNFRGVMAKESAPQRSAIFKSIIWIYSIKSIDLGYNNLQDVDMKDLCEAIHKMNNIAELYLNGNTAITQAGYLHLVNILIDNTGLKKLVLSGCNVKSASAIPLISCIPSSSIEVLDFSACSLDSEFTSKLTQLYFVRKQQLRKYQLKELRLFMNEGLDVESFVEHRESFADLKIDLLQYYKPKPPKELELKTVGLENSSELIKGRYRIDKFIKKGGFGKVYLCTDTYDQSMTKQVAVKMVSFYDISELEGHIKEISHQNFIKNEELIAPLLSIEMNALENKLYLIMPYFKLGDLNDVIYERFIKRQPFPQSMIVRFATKASRALCYLLDNNIVHRDVKPSNFLTCKYTDTELECVLSDFGLATSVSNTQMPVDDTSCTSKYAPPELFESGNSTFKGDVFSLGCTLYEMMSLDSNTIIWNLYKTQGEATSKHFLQERIDKNSKSYDRDLIQLVFSMIDENPQKRPDYRLVLDTLQKIN